MKETYMNKIEESATTAIDLFCFSSFIFKKKITILFKKATLQKNFVMVEEELDGIDADDT